MVDWIGLAVPFAYLGVLIGSLATFSSLYRKRKAAKSLSLAPWFPPHLQRNIYLSLLHLEPTPSDSSSTTTTSTAKKVPESVLKAALLRRATEDINRIVQVRSAKQALSTLLARGSVGDDLWQRFLRAEKEIEEEVRDVVNEVGAKHAKQFPYIPLFLKKPGSAVHSEIPTGAYGEMIFALTCEVQANAFSPNWGQTIFQSANEMANNIILRKRTEEIQAQAQAEREWWEKKRASIQEGFLRELDEGTGTGTGAGAGVGAGAGAGAGGKANEVKGGGGGLRVPAVAAVGEKREQVGASDDDAVFVEGGGPAAAGVGAGGGGGGKGGKKKKGKK